MQMAYKMRSCMGASSGDPTLCGCGRGAADSSGLRFPCPAPQQKLHTARGKEQHNMHMQQYIIQKKALLVGGWRNVA
jgi:hypothetical protein